jgi:3'-phosphoadenosine 5'-phosphosulfate sulfotransferase (PAPS reductase)/FAD synthetase
MTEVLIDEDVLVASAMRTIQRAVDTHKLTHLIGLFSGGSDSMASCYIASKHHLAKQRLQAMEWKFVEESPTTTLRMIVSKYGFPGPTSHPQIYSQLKKQPIRTATTRWRDMIAKETGMKRTAIKIGFITGIRAEESQRRSTLPPIQFQEGIAWINPIIAWKKPFRDTYLLDQGIAKHLNSSRDSYGECDCRCFARPGEVEMKTAALPVMTRYTAKMEELARISRELDLLEVEAGMRDPKDVIHEPTTRWGHGLNASQAKVKAIDAASICNDCEGQLNYDGTAVGEDIDYLMGLKASLKVLTAEGVE